MKIFTNRYVVLRMLVVFSYGCMGVVALLHGASSTASTASTAIEPASEAGLDVAANPTLAPLSQSGQLAKRGKGP